MRYGKSFLCRLRDDAQSTPQIRQWSRRLRSVTIAYAIGVTTASSSSSSSSSSPTIGRRSHRVLPGFSLRDSASKGFASIEIRMKVYFFGFAKLTSGSADVEGRREETSRGRHRRIGGARRRRRNAGSDVRGQTPGA